VTSATFCEPCFSFSTAASTFLADEDEITTEAPLERAAAATERPIPEDIAWVSASVYEGPNDAHQTSLRWQVPSCPSVDLRYYSWLSNTVVGGFAVLMSQQRLFIVRFWVALLMFGWQWPS
jgi:hypothetical protein